MTVLTTTKTYGVGGEWITESYIENNKRIVRKTSPSGLKTYDSFNLDTNRPGRISSDGPGARKIDAKIAELKAS